MINNHHLWEHEAGKNQHHFALSAIRPVEPLQTSDGVLIWGDGSCASRIRPVRNGKQRNAHSTDVPSWIVGSTRTHRGRLWLWVTNWNQLAAQAKRFIICTPQIPLVHVMQKRYQTNINERTDGGRVGTTCKVSSMKINWTLAFWRGVVWPRHSMLNCVPRFSATLRDELQKWRIRMHPGGLPSAKKIKPRQECDLPVLRLGLFFFSSECLKMRAQNHNRWY